VTVPTVTANLNDAQADGRACIDCGRRDGPMVPVGWYERPADMLRRLGVSEDASKCQVFAHVECSPAPPPRT
jgi:hypothetical protein